ncbi:hypothetical protein SAMN05880590_11024 [Rhizobium sp. RU35A]|uniref:Uncharacterized protein n=1 Tax=Rhizobium straminoryzae TaxID=1387186 RepID=A0A549TGM5_9HYPH|nr:MULTISPECIES: hypothetical protein [Rhizobium]TRL41893.1 hypothetical protein FNA46_03210 [Rhizobium straminoryzae]SIQ99178.1 hypothetical protein SAMN05880590_11024 [Rhizobium sp. RU35A]
MGQRHAPAEEAELDICRRFQVEAAMLDMIAALRAKGLDQAEIALTLADAAEDYVLRLAQKSADSDDMLFYQ